MTDTGGHIEISYLETARITHVKVVGRFNLDSVLAQMECGHSYAELPDFRGFLWDWREADLSTVTIETFRTVWDRQSDIGFTGNWRVAALTRSDNARLILKLWESVGTHFSPRERRLFTSMDQAIAWLSGETSAGDDAL
ncbi:hypothetical protein [Nisaea sp.]|uniref:hypothetical protein n=1 Tax=Nisaea sp. TaxID=2024842 RepID=UPI003B5234FD